RPRTPGQIRQPLQRLHFHAPQLGLMAEALSDFSDHGGMNSRGQIAIVVEVRNHENWGRAGSSWTPCRLLILSPRRGFWQGIFRMRVSFRCLLLLCAMVFGGPGLVPGRFTLVATVGVRNGGGGPGLVPGRVTLVATRGGKQVYGG